MNADDNKVKAAGSHDTQSPSEQERKASEQKKDGSSSPDFKPEPSKYADPVKMPNSNRPAEHDEVKETKSFNNKSEGL